MKRIAMLLLIGAQAASAAVFPQTHWETRDPASLGLDPAALADVATMLGGRGCIVKDGYVVQQWGDQAQVADWYSSAKPVLTTLLFFAIEEGKVKGVDQRIAAFGWPLSEKDQPMTFRHLANMVSGYARPEAPGAAWAYNDFAIQLYQKTLFEKVFQEKAGTVAEAPQRLGALGFEDGLHFNQKSRLDASVRDFARIAWFWFNRGHWNGTQVLPRHYFDDYLHVDVPADLPRTAKGPENDYLGIDSYGGHSDQAYYGPGLYGFTWWFNGFGPKLPARRNWPDAPADTIMSLGFGGNCTAMLPSLGLVIACAGGNWGDQQPGDPEAQTNRVLQRLAAARP